MNKRSANEDVCSFFLEKKKRPCRMKKADGMSYCPHHSHLGSEENEKKGARIPCPYDPEHFCYESKLQKHLKKCNAREKDKPEYFVEGINAGNSVNPDEKKVSLSDISDTELLSLINKIRTIYDESNITVSEEYSMHATVQQEMEASSDKLNNFKHMRQQASLLSLMDTNDFLSNGTCFVEFGAGKGQLMYWVIKCVPEKGKCAFVLVDKSVQRHKSDNKFKGTNIQTERIRIDIQNLHLGKVQCIIPHVDKVVGLCKHLCGSATDLALSCLSNTLEICNNGELTKHRPLGMVMALCCHHRCIWSSYVGKEFLNSIGISEMDFKFMCCMASWATCGLRKKDLENKDEQQNQNNEDDQNDGLNNHDDASHTQPVFSDEAFNRYVKLNLKHEEREKVGAMCKRIFDAGRMDYLKKKGYVVKLVTYIEKSVSLENIALVASYKSS